MQKFLTATALFAGSTLAANATTPSASGCVDSSAMTTCLNKAEADLTACIAAAGNDDLVIACGWQDDINKMLCYQGSCWNKAYSCEYQYLVSSYKIQRTVDEKIPFYPAPDKAPGGCSCNLGEVVTNATLSLAKVSNTCNQYTTSIGTNDLTTCQCCAWSAAVSAFYGICPDTSSAGLGLTNLSAQAAAYEGTIGSCSGLTSSNCLRYGIGSADNGKYLDPANLPAGGSQPLSTTSGPSSLTTPPAGATITWTALSQTFTVTAAAYNSADVSAGSTATSTGAGSSSGGGSGGSTVTTGTATVSAGAVVTGKTGTAAALQTSQAFWVMAMIALGVIYM
ncbi:hypothetical protein BGW36DRAFT_352515 [Talaromyces proteolyticus]|uniref:Secreted protein n=1 Tax=Talaromyces proteolyticus TaxID=1131652 RepID=A0AAD4KIC6_9EURO|nr:uncharacterized protein BGW36DRAFT_352515 [Talaromyces proteolyticus]KAH8689123.1 hypothetical protein BGW36DRAFT_352515 [Talaromyces proteolyticus]